MKRIKNQPSLSVVVASGAGGDFLFRCLNSLKQQTILQGVEVIVVDRCGGATRVRIQQNCPFVTLVRADLDHRPSIPELRLLGAKEARGDIVAIIEEHCVAPPSWLETIQSSFRDGDVAIGGPILDHGYSRLRDWVVYFSEYHNYLPPWSDGQRYMLNGANIAYDHKKLLKYKDVLTSGYWEVVLHPLLAKEGTFRSVPRMGVYHTGPFNYGYYLRQRYLLSRVWGGTQKDRVSLAKRLVYLVGAPIFPCLLLARIAHRVIRSGHHFGKFLFSLPLLFLVTTAYVSGEWLGYLSGVGEALKRVE